jgi:prepilin-type N-terminal cleavage/methylation domain-containing protein
MTRNPKPETRNPKPETGNAGFTLVELMVVMSIIAILISMVVSGIWMARRHYAKTEARVTMQQMRIGMINLKQNNNYDPMIPIGVYTSGRTQASGNNFSDLHRDFAADGIDVGDKIYILGGSNSGERNVEVVSVSILTVDGTPFTKNERDLEYFIIKGGGEYYPEVDLGKELDPNNKAWAKTYEPHLNGRKLRYYTCKPRRVRDGQFVDPWGKAYRYMLVPEDGKIVEKIVCGGMDTQVGTDDDLEEVIAEIPFGG